jgi:hypothetical protein
MAITKNGTKSTLLDRLIQEASRKNLRAMAAPASQAKKQWLDAASCEEELACLFEAEKKEIAAAIHYVSAASCFANAKQYFRAVSLLRAALSFSLREGPRREAEKMLKDWLPKAKSQLRRQARKQPAAV